MKKASAVTVARQSKSRARELLDRGNNRLWLIVAITLWIATAGTVYMLGGGLVYAADESILTAEPSMLAVGLSLLSYALMLVLALVLLVPMAGSVVLLARYVYEGRELEAVDLFAAFGSLKQYFLCMRLGLYSLGYPVLIIATPTALSEQNIAEIKKYIENGGIVYASGFAGYYNEIAQKREHWLFGKELLNGADYMNDHTASYKQLRVSSTKEILPSDSPVRYARYFYPKGKNKLDVIWEFVINDKGTAVPALVCNKIGKGKIYFSPEIFATPAYSIEVTSKNIIKFQRKPQAEALAWQILDMFITPEHRIWDASGIPEQVLTSIYKTTGNRIAVHLLNATKSNYKTGDKVPSVAPENAYEPLNEVMSFVIPNVGSVKTVYAYSPDFEGKKVLPYTVQDNAVKVTVPAVTLQCYMILYIEQ